MSDIAKNLERVKENIEKALSNSKNSFDDINLVAVAKNATEKQIEKIWELGVKDIGENKVQKTLPQMKSLSHLDIKWHFVGHLQTNKVKYIIDNIHLIHSLERHSLANELNKRAKALGITLNTLVQVNIALEETKFGLHPDEVLNFVDEVLENYSNLNVKGLMTIAPYLEDAENLRPYFYEMRQIFEEVREKFDFNDDEFDTLSMGMTNDYHIALEEGANMIRIGTALFK